MNLGRRFIGLFQDSPTYGRDRANLISGFTIGTAGLLLNGAVLMLVLPLMLDPDDSDFLEITENVEFGQLLALILLGGATAFATILIPLRLATVFWGPRIGRYFDQIVLSGISPLRFVIGKATSQNLFLGLILFLLLPWLVLSMTLGGVDIEFFLGGLFLLWLYCMALAMVTLWATLYLNELLAAFVVIVGAAILSGFGCAPMPFQPFTMTPFPVLVRPVYQAIPFWAGRIPLDIMPMFVGCTVTMTGIIFVSMFGIYLGPLYGIIRENSTFGEVVRKGDSKRRRWFRLRLHIQRPSEIAFFYENRSKTFRSNEGLIRSAIAWGCLTLLSVTAYGTFVYIVAKFLPTGGGARGWWAYEFHAANLTIHGIGLALSIFIFSHAKNTTYLELPFFRGRKVQVARMDTVSFLLYWAVTTSICITLPFHFEQYVAAPAGTTVFPSELFTYQNWEMDFVQVTLQGTLVLSCAALTLYAMHRLVCLTTWLRSVAFVSIAAVYLCLICGLPVFFAYMFTEMRELRQIPFFRDTAPLLASVSPFVAVLRLFNEMRGDLARALSPLPFYAVHGGLFLLTVLEIRRRSKHVKAQYLTAADQEANL